GEADLPDGVLMVEALTTRDGQARVHVSSFLWDRAIFEGGGSTTPLTRPTQSMQFVGDVSFSGRHVTGSGVVLGQDCTSSPPGRSCDAPADASLSYDVDTSGHWEGNLRVTTSSGVEDWALHLSEWGSDATAASPDVTAIFLEELAPFSSANDVMVEVDHDALS